MYVCECSSEAPKIFMYGHWCIFPYSLYDVCFLGGTPTFLHIGVFVFVLIHLC